MGNSTKSTPQGKRKDSPLFRHASGQWAKKVRGKMHYFGVNEQAALVRWANEKDDLLAGLTPRARKGNSPTLGDLCGEFIASKTRRLSSADCRALLAQDERAGVLHPDRERLKEKIVKLLKERADAGVKGELSIHSWRDYMRVCRSLMDTFGRERFLTDILPEDFEKLRTKWAAAWGPVRVGNEINRARVIFNFAEKNGLIAGRMRYGEGFARPSRKTIRLERATKGPKMFEAVELQRMLKKASQPLKAMILLGINCGYGNSDCGQLPMAALDLAGAWARFARPKTGIDRRCPLWPETVNAIREWLAERPAPQAEAHAGLVFTTAKGGSWFKDTTDNPVSKEMRKLLDSIDINGHRNFYCLRHGFETIAGESRDQVAVDAIMGHDDGSMGNKYRERISDERLQAVAEHVRKWLFGDAKKKSRTKILPFTRAS